MNRRPLMQLLQIISLLLFRTFLRHLDCFILVCVRLQCTGFPAVKVMSDIVAISALGETGQHTCRVRSTVAALAGRHCFVFVFMTGNTVDAFMLGIGFAVQLEGLFVAGSTHLVGGIGRIRYSGRHVSLVTTLAVSSNHIGTMRFVALRTERYLAMCIVAETASQ